MNPLRLRDRPFKIFYSAADDRLHDFYIPALSASIRYDRSAGFFSSSALAVAAAGVARLIQNGGRMRLLVGAQLSPDDVEAIEHGYDLKGTVERRLLAVFEDPADALMRQRLEVLVWMIADGTLEIKVVLPQDAYGHPLPADRAVPYFHVKSGVFTDAYGDQVAFNGSINETETGWLHNFEDFAVFTSWASSPAHLAEVESRFNRLWEGREPGWRALDIPNAARQRLLGYRPDAAPTRDPLEREPVEKRVIETGRDFLTADQGRERATLQYLRDAPYLLNARWLGAATSAIVPWPHQARAAATIVDRFPERFLLCDEVGLGKTIEAGLALRQLLLSGTIRRCLILVPKSVGRQWQEELYEKFALNVPFFDGQVFRDVFEREWAPDTPNPWEGEEVFIASSQLAKRRERQAELLSARPWDLVLVDEAHHARRKDFASIARTGRGRYRPNRLLELLMGRDGAPGLKDRTQAMLLATATPMQVHPVEVWDLLRTLGLGGRWGASARNFLRFFEELRRPFDDVDWGFVFGLVRDFLETGGELDPLFASHARESLGLVDWGRLKGLVSSGVGAQRAAPILKNMPSQARPLAVEMARRHTPLRRYIFRNTRRLLREYVRRGVLQDNVPHREPELVWIQMRDEERALYDRIEEYITHFYQKYEDERKGLGFVMTVYRRRLTSSFCAVRRSLERRLAFLQGRPQPGSVAGADEDDIEQEDLSVDVTEMLGDEERARFRDEIEYVEDFLAELARLGDNDSKVERLLADLDQIFRGRDTALIFTQYTDTMDFLRDQLRQVYGSQVACYSGRGGEVWNGLAWVPTAKEAIKNEFRRGETVKILLCTEAASEGLNLQTCGVLINYDMPWNPMRVEQRIGRIDRIGQVYDRVWIRNYFYQETVEARVYQALENRIAWFQDVVGELQPILAQVGQTIQTVALTPGIQRERVLAHKLDELREKLDAQQVEGFDLDQYTSDAEPLLASASPVTLADLERVLTQSPSLAGRFQPHPEFDRAYWLHTDGGHVAVTFEAALFDAHPYTLRLLTYGSDLLKELLGTVPESEAGQEGQVLRCWVENPLTLCAYYRLDATGRPQRIERLADLEAIYTQELNVAWSEEAKEAARDDFQRDVAARVKGQAAVISARRRAERLALEERGRQVLLQAALVELAMGQQPDLFEQEALPLAFTQAAVTGLKRHAYPFAPLLLLVKVDDLRPSPTDPFYLKIQGESRESLKRQFIVLRNRAAGLVNLLASAPDQDEAVQDMAIEVRTTLL